MLVPTMLIFITAMVYGIFTFCLVDEVKALKQFKTLALTTGFAVSELINGYFFKNLPWMLPLLLVFADIGIIIFCF